MSDFMSSEGAIEALNDPLGLTESMRMRVVYAAENAEHSLQAEIAKFNVEMQAEPILGETPLDEYRRQFEATAEATRQYAPREDTIGYREQQIAAERRRREAQLAAEEQQEKQALADQARQMGQEAHESSDAVAPVIPLFKGPKAQASQSEFGRQAAESLAEVTRIRGEAA